MNTETTLLIHGTTPSFTAKSSYIYNIYVAARPGGI